MDDADRNPSGYDDVMLALHDALYADEDRKGISTREMTEEIERDGVNVERYFERIESMLGQAAAKCELDQASARRQALLQIQREGQRKWADVGEAVKEGLRISLGLDGTTRPALAGVFHRKYQGTSHADKESLLEDLGVLKELEKGSDANKKP